MPRRSRFRIFFIHHDLLKKIHKRQKQINVPASATVADVVGKLKLKIYVEEGYELRIILKELEDECTFFFVQKNQNKVILTR